MNAATVIQIARVCHAANREYCLTIGDTSQKPWDEADQWQRDSAIKGVQFRIDNLNAPASATHDAWMKDKEAAGWILGPIKDAIRKTHPAMLSYAQLPLSERMKDYIFGHIVTSFVQAERDEKNSGSPVSKIPVGIVHIPE